ncbi:hypothetical protein [Acinetobacter radioresistens]|uniref:Uncharacterized protein n=1 Tax=Acinetobacter radioresistens TaxID=40216 RepID=A0A8H2PSF6_ACIRA|nr:hypothetical protein [Acinetobacter radioresistens]TNX93640.1 hypothetical protein FHY67_04155 [Acinetobacter radioresistens]
MNLIEQLGGYEAAKKKANDKGIGFLLSKELLEYRRQHNIFEVGDKVVEITDYPSNDVLTVKSIFDKLLVCESDDFNASYVLSNKYKPYFYVRRATDEEIEAGKRLEVV